MSSGKTWFAIANKTADSADVEIYDEIGGWGVSAKEFIKGLRDLEGRHLNLRINSPGGSIIDGQAIIAALSRHKAGFTAWVDGLAASMASVIACAADRCYMADGAMLMVHRASTISMGDASDLRKDADLLEKFEKSLVSVYEKKTGMAREEIEKMLAAETWMDALEAVALGFADGITDNPPAMAMLTPEKMKARFDSLKKNMTNESENTVEEIIEPAPEAAPVVEEAPAVEAAPAVEEVAAPVEVETKDEPQARASDAILAKFSDITARAEKAEARAAALESKISLITAELSAERENIARLESSLGLSAARIEPAIGAHNDAAPSLVEQFSAIADPAEKTAFFRKHSAELRKFIK